jgi:xanthine dehydrogenase accessory factor
LSAPAAEFARLARDDGRGAIATVVGPPDHPSLGHKLIVREDGTRGGALGDDTLDDAAALACSELMWAERSELRRFEGADVFIDAVAPPPRLIVLGAVDYAAALCKLARSAGWRPYVCDPRTAFATSERFPEAEEVFAGWPDESFAHLGIDRATYIAILTHDPKLDDAALEIALRSDAAYVGAMGSRRAQERRRERLTERGLTDDEIGRMAAPIGLDLGATSPEETALSIMAEVVAVRNGRPGGPLSKSSGRIHEVGS